MFNWNWNWNWLYALGITGIIILGFFGYVIYERTMIHYLRISPDKAKVLIQEEKERGTGTVKVVDVRTDTEWSLGHYPSAIHLPASRIREDAMKILRKGETIIIYCNTGTRARLAALDLEEMGFKKVYYIAETYQSLL
jgi:phage shock protein E